MTDIAVIGIGRWGKNLVRVFDEVADVRICCHNGETPEREWMERNYPEIPVTTDYNEVLSDDAVDAVAVATPIETHFELARRALEAGKEVFVEKPMTATVAEAEQLVDAAQDHGRTVFVGYIFVNHPVFQEVKQRAGTPARILAHWDKSGRFAEPLLPNLASHDLAVGYALYGEPPKTVEAERSICYRGRTDAAAVTAVFSSDSPVNINVNRLAAEDRKTVLIETGGGEVLQWNDRVLYKFNGEDFEEIYRAEEEPLKTECRQFIDAIENGESPVTDAAFGAEVNRMLQQAETSM